MNVPDQAERRRAVLSSGHAFVWASAGTGKTHTLTMRALYWLLTMPFAPAARDTDAARLYTARNRAERLRAARATIRRLVLTTFTRKAAAEMQTRLFEYLDALANAADQDSLEARFQEQDPELSELVQQVLDKLRGTDSPFRCLSAAARALAELATELQVCTLHSYAATILRRHPVAAGLPPTTQFAEEDDATAAAPAESLVDRWWQRVGTDPGLSGQLAALLTVVPLADMSVWLAAVVRNPWLVVETKFGPPDEAVVADILEACQALAAHPQAGRLKLVAQLRGVVNDPQFTWEKLGSFLCAEETRAGLFLDRLKPDTGKNLRAAIKSLSPSHQRWFASYLVTYPPLLAKCLATEHAAHWRQWQDFLASFAAWAEDAAVRELGLVTFDDMVRLAVKLLAGNDAVRREERERLGALLVDEFQDTDPVQLALLSLLLRRDSARDHEVLGFFVGDPKQSIYRFRRADLPAIRHFFAGYATAVKAPRDRVGEFRLTTSFRSVPAITDFVNHLFAQRLPLPGYEQEKLVPIRTAAVAELPEWRLLAGDAAAKTAAARRELAAWETTRLIDEYLASGTTGERGYRDIVVLVATHEELDVLLPVLEQAGIPAISSGAKTFYQRPEVLDALNLLIALHNPQDALAIGALLRSPLFGLSDAQIHQWRRDESLREIFGGDKPLPADLPATVAARVTTMRRLFQDRTRQPLAEWLRQAREFIPASAYGRQEIEGRAVMRIDRVLAAFGRVRQLGLVPPLVWLLEQRARADHSDAFDADLGEDISVTDESMAAVRVMTIHKAKGLQGRFVIVAGWQQVLRQRFGHSRRKPLVSVTDPQGVTIGGFRLPWGPLEIVSPHYPAADRLDRDEQSKEAIRLAYVAATRACDRLVLLSADATARENDIVEEAAQPLPAGETTRTAWAGTLRVTIIPPRPGTARLREPSLAIADTTAWARLWEQRQAVLTQPAAPLLHRPSQPEHPDEEVELEPTDYVGSAGAPTRWERQAAGILAHRYLEKHLGDAAFDQTKFAELLAHGQRGSVPDGAVATARAALLAFFGSAAHQRTRAGRIVARELPVYLTQAGRAWNGVLDLVLAEHDTIIGVDYKLMKPPATLPAAYAQQQRTYQEALQRLFPSKPVRFEFWWLGI